MSAYSDIMSAFLVVNRDDDWNPDGGRSDEDEDFYNETYVLVQQQQDGAV